MLGELCMCQRHAGMSMTCLDSHAWTTDPDSLKHSPALVLATIAVLYSVSKNHNNFVYDVAGAWLAAVVEDCHCLALITAG